jgi:hypothetical protein
MAAARKCPLYDSGERCFLRGLSDIMMKKVVLLVHAEKLQAGSFIAQSRAFYNGVDRFSVK